MSERFNITQEDLHTKGSVLLYKDTKGKLFLDAQKGFFAAVERFVTVLLGQRDYKLEKIVNNLTKQQELLTSEQVNSNLDFLCGKIAKKHGIDPTTYAKVLLAEEVLFPKKHTPDQKKNGEAFFKTIAADSSIQKNLIAFQKSLPSEFSKTTHLQEVLERAHITHRWIELGLDMDLINNDYEGAKFLVKSRLIYSIVGFQNSTVEGAEKNAIKVDNTGCLLIKQQGKYVSVKDLVKKLVFDRNWQELTTKTNPEERWNYFSPNGLVPVDRWLHPEFIHV